MKLEDQVVSLELSKKLKEVGVKQESWLWWEKWHEFGDDDFEIAQSNRRRNLDERFHVVISAFTVAELGELLHEKTPLYDDKTQAWVFIPRPEEIRQVVKNPKRSIEVIQLSEKGPKPMRAQRHWFT